MGTYMGIARTRRSARKMRKTDGLVAADLVGKRDRFAKFPMVKQKIRHAILRGELHPHQQLPAFHHVAKQMGVGSVTAKRAIDELVREGWLVSRRGVGTFVSPRHSLAQVVLTAPISDAFEYLFEGDELDTFHAENPG